MSTEKKVAKVDSEKKSKKRRKAKKTLDAVTFKIYCGKILKQVHPEIGISGTALEITSNIAKMTICKIMDVANQFIQRSSLQTLGEKVVESAVRIVFPGELSKHAISELRKALEKYKSYDEKNPKSKKSEEEKKSVRRNTKAGLQLDVARVQKLMNIRSVAKRKSDKAAVAMAAAVEYLIAEVLELSGNVARDTKKARITQRHIKIAILNDEELNKFFKNAVIGGGVLPKINEKVTENSGKKSVKKEKSEETKPKASKPVKNATKKKPTPKATASKTKKSPPTKKKVTPKTAKKTSTKK